MSRYSKQWMVEAMLVALTATCAVGTVWILTYCFHEVGQMEEKWKAE